MEKLDSNLLEEFIYGFYGYGNWKSKFWFVGIEEGGGADLDYVKRKLESWRNLGQTDLVDKDEMHRQVCIPKYDAATHNSKTWDRLILTKCGIDSEHYEEGLHRKKISLYKEEDWGQIHSHNSLIELFPLPSPTMNKWYYNDWSDLDYLATRELYKKNVVEKRKAYFRSKIKEFQPELILFYGTGMRQHWVDILGENFKERKAIGDRSFEYTLKDNSLFVLTPQPSYIRGYKFWRELGEQIKIQLSSKPK